MDKPRSLCTCLDQQQIHTLLNLSTDRLCGATRLRATAFCQEAYSLKFHRLRVVWNHLNAAGASLHVVRHGFLQFLVAPTSTRISAA